MCTRRSNFFFLVCVNKNYINFSDPAPPSTRHLFIIVRKNYFILVNFFFWVMLPVLNKHFY